MQKITLPFQLAGIIFILVGLIHLLRVIFKVPVMVGNYSVPMWASVAAFVFPIFLGIWILKSIK